MTFTETGCLRFVWALNAHARRQHFLTQHSLVEFNARRCYLRDDERAGFCISEDGELSCLFAPQGEGSYALAIAINECGARKLDCFDDGRLPSFYARFGFREVRRERFDPKLAPPGWKRAQLAEYQPDVVWMVRP